MTKNDSGLNNEKNSEKLNIIVSHFFDTEPCPDNNPVFRELSYGCYEYGTESDFRHYYFFPLQSKSRYSEISINEFLKIAEEKADTIIVLYKVTNTEPFYIFTRYSLSEFLLASTIGMPEIHVYPSRDASEKSGELRNSIDRCTKLEKFFSSEAESAQNTSTKNDNTEISFSDYVNGIAPRGARLISYALNGITVSETSWNKFYVFALERIYEVNPSLFKELIPDKIKLQQNRLPYISASADFALQNYNLCAIMDCGMFVNLNLPQRKIPDRLKAIAILMGIDNCNLPQIKLCCSSTGRISSEEAHESHFKPALNLTGWFRKDIEKWMMFVCYASDNVTQSFLTSLSKFFLNNGHTIRTMSNEEAFDFLRSVDEDKYHKRGDNTHRIIRRAKQYMDWYKSN